MTVNNIVTVNIQTLASLSEYNDYFNSISFVYSSDTDKEVVRVINDGDIVEHSIPYNSERYNFYRSVSSQGFNTPIYFVPRPTHTSLRVWYNSNSHQIKSYFVIIESKNTKDIVNFHDELIKDTHLLFCSTDKDETPSFNSRKIGWFKVSAYDNSLMYDSSNIVTTDDNNTLAVTDLSHFLASDFFWLFDFETNSTPTIVEFDNEDSQVTLEYDRPELTKEEADELPYLYPEAAWVARCNYLKPSSVQWLYKKLNGVAAWDTKDLPSLASTYSTYKFDEVTLGSGKTCQGVCIEQQVSLDWVKISIQAALWNLLKEQPKIPETKDGLYVLEQTLSSVLSGAVKENVFTSFKIYDKKLLRNKSSASFKFKATLTHSILGVDHVEGLLTF